MQTKLRRAQLRAAQDVLDVLCGRWRTDILDSLTVGSKRFNDLQRDLGEITPRVLIKELKLLEVHQLVSRHTLTDSPGRAAWGLTDHGRSLAPVMSALATWGMEHRAVVSKRRSTKTKAES